MRILIAEDDLISQKLIAKTVAPFGEVQCVDNGKTAILQIEDALRAGQPYNLICLDVLMPHYNGIDVLKKLRILESQSGIGPDDQSRVIMITSLDDKDHFLRAFHEGSEWFITKPINRHELLSVIEDLGFSPISKPPVE
jgi:two-component system chemotaxis response regulator CheY